jgi:hypothetical protein
MHSIIYQAVEEKSKLTELDSQRQRWKITMTSDRYAHASRAGRLRLEAIRDEYDKEAHERRKKLENLITTLAEFPESISSDGLDLGIEAELKDLALELKEVKASLGNTRPMTDGTAHQTTEQSRGTDDAPPMKRQRMNTDASSDEREESSTQFRLDQLDERLRDLERLESGDVRIWDAVWEKVQQKFDEFAVEQQLEDRVVATQELRKEVDFLADRDRVVSGEMESLASDLAVVIERQTQVEFLSSELLAEAKNKDRIYNEVS